MNSLLTTKKKYSFIIHYKYFSVSEWLNQKHRLNVVRISLMHYTKRRFLFIRVFVFFLVSYGIGRTGVYCLLHTMYHQIARENTVSIYQVARLYNFQRPNCISAKVRNCLFSLTSVSVFFSGSSGWGFCWCPSLFWGFFEFSVIFPSPQKPTFAANFNWPCYKSVGELVQIVTAKAMWQWYRHPLLILP